MKKLFAILVLIGALAFAPAVNAHPVVVHAGPVHVGVGGFRGVNTVTVRNFNTFGYNRFAVGAYGFAPPVAVGAYSFAPPVAVGAYATTPYVPVSLQALPPVADPAPCDPAPAAAYTVPAPAAYYAPAPCPYTAALFSGVSYGVGIPTYGVSSFRVSNYNTTLATHFGVGVNHFGVVGGFRGVGAPVTVSKTTTFRGPFGGVHTRTVTRVK